MSLPLPPQIPGSVSIPGAWFERLFHWAFDRLREFRHSPLSEQLSGDFGDAMGRALKVDVVRTFLIDRKSVPPIAVFREAPSKNSAFAEDGPTVSIPDPRGGVTVLIKDYSAASVGYGVLEYLKKRIVLAPNIQEIGGGNHPTVQTAAAWILVAYLRLSWSDSLLGAALQYLDSYVYQYEPFAVTELTGVITESLKTQADALRHHRQEQETATSQVVNILGNELASAISQRLQELREGVR